MTEDETDFAGFFRASTGFGPYDWQIKVATDGLPDVLPIPTGLGKTEGAVLAWAWRKLILEKEDEPLHLVYCLPMRSLVRQTVERLRACFKALKEKRGFPDIPVYQLMGGAIDEDWAGLPDRPWVLVGTQDQLLSRALNRGYAMSRFDWPVHFGLLNQDCRWIVDEVQLMGPGLWTTAQLDWMRLKRFCSLKPCRTTWMSATIGTSFLKTTDRTTDGLDAFEPFVPELDKDQKIAAAKEELKRRRGARRPVEWFEPRSGKNARPLHEQIAAHARKAHSEGTLTLVICNTVQAAQDVFRALGDDGPPKILLTSRFRGCDRQAAEAKLTEYEAGRRKAASGQLEGDSGLICVSTQVVEAGIDISAHRLWSELAPWPSIIQRLGRLNRDGRDNEAEARVWELTASERKALTWKHGGESWVGPYREQALKDAKVLLNALTKPPTREPFAQAVAKLKDVKDENGEVLERTLKPPLEPHPRALDVHGLFSTEPDMHGGFTDVSRFVRGDDPDADVTVFWRDWSGEAPPVGDELDGPVFDPREEGCQVSVNRLRDALKNRKGARAWNWNSRDERWESRAVNELTPGMVVMLHAGVGSYSAELGWTGKAENKLQDLPPPGPGGALQRDERVFVGYWAPVSTHLADARSEAQKLCDEIGLGEPHRTAVIEGAGLHDLGKLHRDWQAALPAGGVIGNGPWAKAPYVLRVEPADVNNGIQAVIEQASPGALALAPKQDRNGQAVGLRWALDRKLKRDKLEQVRQLDGVKKAVHEAFRPGLRHEAASALAMWHRYQDGAASYSALAVYLVAAHHGKVRTVLRSIKHEGDDVFGVRPDSAALASGDETWPMDFSIAVDGAEGEWTDDGFLLTGHGWTGLVADLLGPWRCPSQTASTPIVVPENEPHHLGPFALAWLEALVRVADWRASDNPSQCKKPSQISGPSGSPVSSRVGHDD